MGKVLRPIRIEGDVAYVPLTRGMTAIIDADDAPLVYGYNWSALKGRGGLIYAGRGQAVVPLKPVTILLHRFIMGAGPGDPVVEHRDRDTMNCRRSNLRIADQTINNQNSSLRKDNLSGYRGVWFEPGKRRTKPWKAQINHKGKMHRLNGFPTAEEAARAYDAKALELYGPDANLNF